ncbi:fluoride efflux transporter CrcB [Paenibacillus sp. MBLB4367]|uniref:fluoride efflux transporter CrcB n=1 Tax=Paenibacillus sp. MBLB4367 TaxID=3384767 RepID=UPI00390830D9
MGKINQGIMLAIVASAGMVGALLRYGAGILVHGLWASPFPLGTLLINVAGCIALGWFLTRFSRYESIHPYLRTGIATGLIGSFTTFSTFSIETVELLREGLKQEAMAYVVISFWGGLLAAWLGSRLAAISGKAIGGRSS